MTMVKFFKNMVIFTKLKSDFQALLFLAWSSFLGLSLFSYNPDDPSFFSSSFGPTRANTNVCGYLGSFSADLLYQSFGVCAWGFVLFFFLLFWSRIQRESRLNFERNLVFLAGLFTLCTALGFFDSFYLYNGIIFGGGAFGKHTFLFLKPLINIGGIFIFVAVSLTICVLSYFDLSLSEIQIPHLKFKFPFKRNAFPRISNAGVEEVSSMNDVQEEDLLEVEAPKIMPPIPTVSRKQNFKELKIPKVVSTEGDWELPSSDLLGEVPDDDGMGFIKDEEIQKKAKLLIAKLEQFSVKGQIMGIKTGPAVTLFEFKPNVNVKISRITELADDLSLALASESVRIIAPIPGRDVVGIETSNQSRSTVFLKEVLSTEEFWDEDENKIPIGLGKRADGEPMVVDLRKMPHLLVAGSTGSGKSVFVVSTITSLLMRYSPEELRLVMVDPKQVDLAVFEDLPHLILPIIKEPKKAISSLRWAIREMEKRYRSMAKFGARDLESFNNVVEELSDEEFEECEEENEELENSKKGHQSYYFERLPYIVIIVEEFGDLMAVDKSNVEQAVVRLAQMARACGIHLILAMQSPRKDVVTGLIKTNIPGRISFKVASKTDSRIILDETGGERLLARGDMLFLSPGVSKPLRAHGSWVPEDVIQDIVEFWREQGEPEYLFEENENEESSQGFPQGSSEEELDERYDEIVEFVSTQKAVSASLLQRRFRIGYPRAARLIEILESQGVVGPAQGSKPRKVLVKNYSENPSP